MDRKNLFLFAFLLQAIAQDTTLNIYDGKDGKLQNGWENWSWATVNYTDTKVVRPGKNFSLSAENGALYLHGSFASVYSQLKTLHFWVNAGDNGGHVFLKVINGDHPVGYAVDLNSVIGRPLQKNTWTEANVLFTMFGNLDQTMLLDGLWWKANTAGTIYLDDISVIEGPPADQFSENMVSLLSLSEERQLDSDDGIMTLQKSHEKSDTERTNRKKP